MRRFFFCILLMAAMVARAQVGTGTWSLIPHVGISIAKFSNDEIFLGPSMADAMTAQYRTGFTGGADVRYQLARSVALSLGVAYTQRGTKYKNAEHQESENPATYVVGHDSWQRLGYIDVPLMAHLFVAPGLALNVGVQPSFLVDAKMHYESQAYTLDEESGARQWGQNEETDSKNKSLFQAAQFSIPMGLSYEYEHVVLDVRYDIPVTKACKKDAGSDARNRGFLLTVGYRFDLN